MKHGIYILSILMLTQCTKPTKVSTNITHEKEEVMKTLDAMWAAIEKGNADEYATYVHPDFTQFGETDSVLLVGKTAEVEGIRAYLKEAKNVHTEMISPRVTIKGDVAWITYYWQDHGERRGEPIGSHGKSTRIFVKEDNQWRCIHGHYTLLTFIQ